MKYVSTRNNSVYYDFKQVLFRGFAPDGGLFVPNEIPTVPWKSWKGKSYPFVVGELLKIYLDDPQIPVHDLLNNVYNDENFDNPSIAPLVRVNDKIVVLELFHGPTWSFKDYALILVGQLLQYYLEKENKRICLLIATSGDTGSSAIESVKNKSNIDIVVLYPYKRISAIQEMQMTSVKAKNVQVIAVDCNSDDLDCVIKEVISDEKFADEHNLGSVNSINWARICIQMAHWFYTYLQVVKDIESGRILNFAVPVGAAGNLTAGLYAQMMGLPIRMIPCNNKNEVVHNWIHTGTLSSTEAQQSLAVAMDIQVPYNVERIIYMLSNGNVELTSKLMQEFYATNKCQMPAELRQKLLEKFQSCSVSDEEIVATIKNFQDKYSYQCCPHTATSLVGARLSLNELCICIATAAPYKFPDLFKSMRLKEPDNPRLKKLTDSPSRKVPIWYKGEDWTNSLKAIICSFENE